MRTYTTARNNVVSRVAFRARRDVVARGTIGKLGTFWNIHEKYCHFREIDYGTVSTNASGVTKKY